MVAMNDNMTPLERHLLDAPYEDDGLSIPPFDSLNPFLSRASFPPVCARVGGSRPTPTSREPLLIGALKVAGGALLLLFIVALVFLGFHVITPETAL